MKKSNFKVFFKKLPDDYLFESMIIFFIFFGAIPETHIPRDIKFNLSSVPAQCAQLFVSLAELRVMRRAREPAVSLHMFPLAACS